MRINNDIATLKFITPITMGKLLFLHAFTQNNQYRENMRKSSRILSVIVGCIIAMGAQAQTPADSDTIRVQQIDEVVVTHQRQLVKNEIDKLTYDVQHDESAKSKTILEILKKVPLVTVDGQDNIKVQGSSSFKIYRNGHPDPSLAGSNAKDILKSIPASSIKKIEVITDPGAKYDAEGTTSILNIVTLSDSRLQGVAGSLQANANSRGSVGTGGFITTQVGKLILTANYNYWYQAAKEVDAETEVYKKYLQSGEYSYSRGKNKQPVNIHYGNIDGSYDIDSLNLLSFSFGGMYYTVNLNGISSEERYDAHDNLLYKYKELFTMPGYSFYNLNGRADYQHKTKREGEVFTLSYMLATTRRHDTTRSDFAETQNFPIDYKGYEKQNRERFVEHTLQLDYVRPLAKLHTMEMGLKYINRSNKSDSRMVYFGKEQNMISLFNHDTQVAATYLSYLFHSERWSARAGLRYEYSYLKASYPNGSAEGFHRNLNDWVPSASVQYKITDSQSLKLSYGMKIRRPGITYLNPAVFKTPTSISYGNVHLNSSKSHSISLAYSFMSPKVTFSFYPSYTFANNLITTLRFVNDGIVAYTYANDMKYRAFKISGYIQWHPFAGTNLNLNGNITNEKKSIPAPNLSLSAWGGEAFLSLQQQLPWKLTMNVDGGGKFGRNIDNVYGYGGRWYYYSFSLTRSFLKDKLNVSVFTSMPFTNHDHMKSSIVQGDYIGYDNWEQKSRNFGIRLSWRFGKLKASVKKADKTIQNNDVVGGIGK